jgi:TPR repeat protein
MMTRLSLLFVAIAATSCGGPAAQTLRPGDPSYARAVGERCSAGDGNPQPLVVDWRPEARADLEVAMRRGVAVVAYDCASLRVLADCTLDGGYGFVGVSLKGQTLHLATADEIKANLPAGIVAATFGSEIERGASIDVELSIVGKQMSTVADGHVGQLRGRCGGATHLVRAVTTGAFSLATQTSANVDAELGVVGVSGRTAGKSEKTVQQQDGDRAACAAATPDATSPPAGCAAPLRLDLVALGAAPVVAPAAPAGGIAAAMGQGFTPAPSESGSCPFGLVWSGGACRAPREDLPRKCDAHDPGDCQRQCDLGDGASCNELGFAHMVGKKVGLDRRRAYDLFERACGLGDLHGCNNQGAILISYDRLPYDQLDRAVRLFDDTCAKEPTLCTNRAVMLRDGVHARVDKTRAAELFSRACVGGNASACHDLALAYDEGVGVGRDVARATELELQACHGGHMHSCTVTGAKYLYGTGVAKDEVAAVSYFRRGCDGGNLWGCGMVGLSMWEGLGGLRRDPATGRRRMEEACERGSNDSCALLGLVLKTTGDVAGSRPWLRRACDGGLTDHCE